MAERRKTKRKKEVIVLYFGMNSILKSNSVTICLIEKQTTFQLLPNIQYNAINCKHFIDLNADRSEP